MALIHIPKDPGFYPGASFDPAFFEDDDNKNIDLNFLYRLFYLPDTLFIFCHIASHHDILFIDYGLIFKLEYYNINWVYISNFRFTYFNFNFLILFLYVIIAFSNTLLKIIFMLTIYGKQTKKEWKRKIKKILNKYTDSSKFESFILTVKDFSKKFKFFLLNIYKIKIFFFHFLLLMLVIIFYFFI